MAKTSQKQIARSISRAAALKAEIDSITARVAPLQKELDDTKAFLYECFPEPTETAVYKGDDGVSEVEVRIKRVLNTSRAFERYGKKVTERVVTPAAVKAALTPAQAEELYDFSKPSLYLRQASGE